MSDSLEVVASAWFRREFGELQKEQRNRINRKLSELAEKGWSAAMADQTIKHLHDGIYEVRVLGRPAFRLLFFVVPGRRPRVVVLTTCAAKSLMKKRQRLTAEVERAKSRRAAWTAEHMIKKEEADGR